MLNARQFYRAQDAVALLVGVYRNSVNAFYHRLCVIIHDKLFEAMEELAGEIEVDESYFGRVRKGYLGCRAQTHTLKYLRD